MKEDARRKDVDIARFIAAICIMIFHGNYYNVGYSKHHFYGAWIFVELFFMLTGYFTAMHFFNIKCPDDSDDAKESFFYVLKKLRPVYFFFFTALLLTYSFKFFIELRANGFKKIMLIDYFNGFLKESLLLYAPGYCSAYLNSAWYVSALFWTLPIIAYLLRKIKSEYTYIFSGFFSVVFYAKRGVLMRQGGLDDIFRAFAAISLGVFLYGICKIIRDRGIVVKKIIQLPVLVVFLGNIFYYINGSSAQFEKTKNCLVLIFLFLCFILCQKDLIPSNIMDKPIFYLGKLSLPIYLYQLPAGIVASKFIGHYQLPKIWGGGLYIIVTILFSVFFDFLYTYLKRIKKCKEF